jgi:ubiquinone/menaquinone biosynthesis C-methylase UbiE
MMTSNDTTPTPAEIQKNVREYYAAALKTKSGTSSGCCCGGGNSEPCCGESQNLYEDPAVSELPGEVMDISFGCGDPVTLASLLPGQSVLDLGSGGGIDCFLAARKVGPTGHVIGVDMTPQMIDRARANKAVLGVENVEFRLGEIEHLPVEENSVDVVISNCVINLSPDKEQVFKEIFRVLKPGGKLAVSDIVTDGDLPKEIKQNLAAWAGCVAGAVDIQQYSAAIQRAGLVQIEVTPDYLPDQMIAEAVDQLPDELVQTLDQESLYRSVYSARITARKP